MTDDNRCNRSDYDDTPAYIEAARQRGWVPSDGISLDKVCLSGEAATVYADFRRLREYVAQVGHGDDTSELPSPSLVACLSDTRMGAQFDWANEVSKDAETWDEYKSKLDSLT